MTVKCEQCGWDSHLESDHALLNAGWDHRAVVWVCPLCRARERRIADRREAENDALALEVA